MPCKLKVGRQLQNAQRTRCGRTGESVSPGHSPLAFLIRVESMSATTHGFGNTATRRSSADTAAGTEMRGACILAPSLPEPRPPAYSQLYYSELL